MAVTINDLNITPDQFPYVSASLHPNFISLERRRQFLLKYPKAKSNFKAFGKEWKTFCKKFNTLCVEKRIVTAIIPIKN